MTTAYAFTIEKWSCGYTFSTTDVKSSRGRSYADRRTLEVSGTLTHPRKSSGRRMELRFSSPVRLEMEYVGYHLADVGSVTWSRNSKAFTGHLYIADDALPCIIPLLIAGKLRHVLLQSKGPFRGSLTFMSYSFIEELTDDYFN
ncbi:hypothetical protein [Reyranella sp.]|uniref:hypothetical protein n=1 Tax=Reyranella sp. TaxID=1929291 RepID=UPI002731637F|nr:hypothetical protein [Reyranella sp.]MDP2377809.1 hypothetical protein [Reyranella sp.]